jgi:hypothetical protein
VSPTSVWEPSPSPATSTSAASAPSQVACGRHEAWPRSCATAPKGDRWRRFEPRATGWSQPDSNRRPSGCKRAERAYVRAIGVARAASPALQMSAIEPAGSTRSCAAVSARKYRDVPVRYPPPPRRPGMGPVNRDSRFSLTHTRCTEAFTTQSRHGAGVETGYPLPIPSYTPEYGSGVEAGIPLPTPFSYLGLPAAQGLRARSRPAAHRNTRVHRRGCRLGGGSALVPGGMIPTNAPPNVETVADLRVSD